MRCIFKQFRSALEPLPQATLHLSCLLGFAFSHHLLIASIVLFFRRIHLKCPNCLHLHHCLPQDSGLLLYGLECLSSWADVMLWCLPCLFTNKPSTWSGRERHFSGFILFLIPDFQPNKSYCEWKYMNKLHEWTRMRQAEITSFWIHDLEFLWPLSSLTITPL